MARSSSATDRVRGPSSEGFFGCSFSEEGGGLAEKSSSRLRFKKRCLRWMCAPDACERPREYVRVYYRRGAFGWRRPAIVRYIPEHEAFARGTRRRPSFSVALARLLG